MYIIKRVFYRLRRFIENVYDLTFQKNVIKLII